ncbi:tumor necrosis factor receptor superfamily member 6B [Nothobranchius furzeri]
MGHFWHFLPSLLPIALLSAVLNVVYPLTFTHRDPFTGRSLQCDRCPPGTFLRARCSTAKSSECAPCPQGSFTELWNYVGRCLRCGVCGRNQVVKKECTAKSDCQCECKRGYYYSHDVDMCVRHSECPSGSGVLTPGTPENDTVCHICSNGTFSDVSSAHERCKQHKNCSGAGQLLLLQGSSWHDRLCGSCGELTNGAECIKEIIPSFFVHHTMNIKRLRRVVNKLPSDGGRSRKEAQELSFSQLLSQINSWVSSATITQIKLLPDILEKCGAASNAERIQKKFDQIDTRLLGICNSGRRREEDATL